MSHYRRMTHITPEHGVFNMENDLLSLCHALYLKSVYPFNSFFLSFKLFAIN
uniref:Uncharacterized protein n=1 Tax=Rhizophagus irregularis (strain DAOM 181602 / DAOM 197198 / MUCL 43194) TaxID=747089 RepID=U9U7M5_RHIID